MARAAATPASPGGGLSDAHLAAKGDVVYLVGAYARYNWPYVWLRAGGNNTGSDLHAQGARDVPLELRTTAAWGDEGVHVWHVVHELIQRSFAVPPVSPFAVDRQALMRLPALQRALAAGALAAFFKEALLSPMLASDNNAGTTAAPPSSPSLARASSGNFPGFHAAAPPKANSLSARRNVRTEPLEVEARESAAAGCAPPWLSAGRAQAEDELVWCLETHFHGASAIVRRA